MQEKTHEANEQQSLLSLSTRVRESRYKLKWVVFVQHCTARVSVEAMQELCIGHG